MYSKHGRRKARFNRVSGDRRGDAVGFPLSARRRCNGRRQAERAGVTPRIARSKTTTADRGREGLSPPRPPNRTGGFPAYGSPVGGFFIESVSQSARPCEVRAIRLVRRTHWASEDGPQAPVPYRHAATSVYATQRAAAAV